MALPVLFAPLQGLTDAAYRSAHAALCGGITSYYTPFLRIEKGLVRRRELRDLEREGDALYSIVPQVIANDVEEFAELCASLIERGCLRIDLNCGCPYPMQVNKGRGAGLLRNADALRRIVDKMRFFSEERGVTFSVKMRLGLESSDDCMRLLPILHAAPLRCIVMHPRVACQQYKGKVDMAGFRRFYEACDLPLVYNGDLMDMEQMVDVERAFPDLNGLMVGRGLLARPTMAQEYASGIGLSDADVRRRILMIHDKMLEHYSCTLEGGSGQVLQKIRSYWEFCGGLFDQKKLKKLLKSRSLIEYEELVKVMQ